MSESVSASGKLSVGTKLGFGVCDLGGNLFFTFLGFYAIIYLTDTVGIPVAIAGAITMIGKLFDAAWDPVLGYLSDHTKTTWGRRRPYIVFGSFPLLLAMVFFCTNPRLASPGLLIAWGAVAFILLNMVYSVVNIPYSSLTPELTKDYNERSSLNGYRFMFAVVGTIIGGVAVQPILNAFGGAGGGDKSLGFTMVGIIFGVIMMVTALITGFSVREPKGASDEATDVGGLKDYLSVFRNKPYLNVLITYGLHIIGLTFLQTTINYYFKYIYVRESLVPIVLALLLGTAMICIPISVAVSKRIGKKRTYQISLFILATASLVIFFLGHLLGPTFFLVMTVYAGIGVGFAYMPPYSMVPDTIELDAVTTGMRKEGAYYGIVLFVSKVGAALAFLTTGVVLGLGGFIANVAQTDSAKLAIRVSIGPIPAAFLLAGMILVQFYPIDEKKYAEILAGKGAS